MQTIYTVRNVVKRARGAVVADLYEDDYKVATVRRAATVLGFVPPYTMKFLTDRAANRFDSFCDSLSRSETIEALLG